MRVAAPVGTLRAAADATRGPSGTSAGTVGMPSRCGHTKLQAVHRGQAYEISAACTSSHGPYLAEESWSSANGGIRSTTVAATRPRHSLVRLLRFAGRVRPKGHPGRYFADMNRTYIRQVGTVRWCKRTAVRQFYKRVMRRDITLRLPTGLEITLPRSSQSGSEAYVTGANVDLGAEKLFAHLADGGRDFLDVGANIGYYSLYMAPRVRRVYAFEPDARCLPALTANAKTAGNIEIVTKVVAEVSGAVGFDVSGGTEFSHISDDADNRLAATSIDDFVEETGSDVGQLKIDAEGHDLTVLMGAQRTLELARPLVLTEYTQSPEGINEAGELYALCDELDYEIYGLAYGRDQNPAEAVLRQMCVDDDEISKMLFLVPPRLANVFADQAVAKPSR